MRKFYFLILFCLMLLQVGAQQVATFENVQLTGESWWNGSDGSGGILSGGINFPNSYNSEYSAWSGFSVSNTTDTTTRGYGNQYSAIAGSGAGGSSNYAVAYVSGELVIEFDEVSKISGFYATNSTYTYLSMKDGDDFTKKFGGAEGTDPDYLMLVITGYDAGNNKTDSVIFYLADFTSEDPGADYLVKEWQWVDLDTLGNVASVGFRMKSTDEGAWGMNTPAYFCLDNFTITPAGATASQTTDIQKSLKIYPNPVRDHFWAELPSGAGKLTVTDSFGRPVDAVQEPGAGKTLVTLPRSVPSGIYLVRVESGNTCITRKILKR